MEKPPKEYAKELINELHYQICSDNGLSESDTTKLCAIRNAKIAVDRILSEIYSGNVMIKMSRRLYLQQVKTEIENYNHGSN